MASGMLGWDHEGGEVWLGENNSNVMSLATFARVLDVGIGTLLW